MGRKLCAVGLIVLAALPFTAPFAAIDAAHALFGKTTAETGFKLAPSSLKEGDAAEVERPPSSRQTIARVTIGDPVIVILPGTFPACLESRLILPLSERLPALRI